MSIPIVSLCNGASWCEHAASLLSARLLAIARAPISAESATLLAGMALVMGAEILVLGYSRSSAFRLLHPTRSTRADIVWFLLRVFGLTSLVVAVSSLGLTTLGNRLATEYAGLHVLAKIRNPVLQGAAYVIASDFLSYWVHRGRHAFGWWWEFHKHHHSATEFNAITQTRAHPLDWAGIILCSAVPVQLLGGTMGDSLFVLTVFGVHAGLTHSMLPWRWGWFGRYALYSPVGHRIHHSALPEHTDRNFGALLPAWDWLFGTYYKGDVINEEVGVEDNYQNTRGLAFDLVESMRRAWRSVSPASGLVFLRR